MSQVSPVALRGEYRRKFLVLIDETEECDRALTFAVHRVLRTGGTVVLLSVLPPPDFHGLGVEDVLRAEAMEAAEANLDARMARIATIGNVTVETVVREGRATDEIVRLIEEDAGIAILVLAASGAAEGPGPLVNHFATRTVLPIPLTIIPGTMSDEAIIAVC